MGFDPNKFLEQSTDKAMQTSMSPCPEGEYLAQVEKVEAFPVKERETQQVRSDAFRLQITWDILDQDLLDSLDRKAMTVRQSIFIDLDDDGSFADGKDKNVGLGKLRAAVNQNSGPWQPNDLIGQQGIIKVGHRPNPTNDAEVYAQVNAVAPVR